jgi:hypothetical protein
MRANKQCGWVLSEILPKENIPICRLLALERLVTQRAVIVIACHSLLRKSSKAEGEVDPLVESTGNVLSFQ